MPLTAQYYSLGTQRPAAPPHPFPGFPFRLKSQRKSETWTILDTGGAENHLRLHEPQRVPRQASDSRTLQASPINQLSSDPNNFDFFSPS